MESILMMLEWALASVPALIAICEACVLLRRENGETSLHNAVNFVALAAVISVNAWLFWVCVSFSGYLHGTVTMGAVARFQRSFEIGLFATSLTFALAFFGKGRGLYSFCCGSRFITTVNPLRHRNHWLTYPMSSNGKSCGKSCSKPSIGRQVTPRD